MSVHEIHCTECIFSNCNFNDCEVIQCKNCRVNLHKCKLDDHLENICQKVMVPCINSINGCPHIIIRKHISRHLLKCPANVVVCFRDRCRKVISKSAKLELKKMGKMGILSEPNSSEALDIQLALFDQDEIIRSYSLSRDLRVRQRDFLHPSHPLLPLREMTDFDVQPSVDIDFDFDSSEDERREKIEKLKKQRLVFANCYFCQIDPSVQHLHTLGNGTELSKARKRRVTSKTLDTFHKNNGLKINFSPIQISETFRKGENIYEHKKGGFLYMMKCLKTIHRSEFYDHFLSQHANSIDEINEHVVRCPNWSSGCEFFTSRIKPRHGKLRFVKETSTISHYIETECQFKEPSDDVFNLETVPLLVYQKLADYLPSSAIYCLSLTSRIIRQKVFVGCYQKSYVEVVWKRDHSGWQKTGFIWKFSTTEKLPQFKWNVISELSTHLQSCEFFNATKYTESRVRCILGDSNNLISSSLPRIEN